MQLVICAFPGTGKSTISNDAEKYGLIRAHVHYDDRDGVSIDLLKSDKPAVFDSDSSIFPKENFPQNYIEHIKYILSWKEDCVVMVSSHDNVREALREAGIDYILVYPQRELKGDYLERYVSRGSPEAFVTMMDNKWNDFIDSCEADPSTSKRVLSEGEFLVDKIEELKKFWPAAPAVSNEAFPTAVISGTESIGDIVCDAEGKPVAGWGPNGLEPLPEGFGGTAPVVTTGDVVAITTVASDVSVDPASGGVNVQTPDGGVAIGAEEVIVQADNGVVASVDTGTGEVVVQEPAVETNPTAAIFSAVTADAPNPAPVVAPAPEVVDLVALTTADIPVVAAVDAPEVAPVVVDNGVTTAEVVSVELAPTDVPVSGVAIVAGNEDGSGEVTVAVEEGTGTVQVNTPDGTVTVTNDEVVIDGKGITMVEDGEVVQTDADRSELIELKLDMENDIDAMEPVIEKAKSEEDRGGLESLQDGSDFFIKAAEEAKTSYGLDIEPTLAGMEGFLDSLKGAVGKVTQALKGKGSAKAVIKRTVHEARQAVGQYGSSDWQGKQEFINVGKTKVSTPAIFKDVSSVGDVATIVGMITKQTDTAVTKYASNIKQRLAAGTKVLNQFKGKDPKDEKVIADLKDVTITPELLKGAVEDSGLKNVSLKTSMVELPVLNKDAVAEASKLLGTVVGQIDKVWTTADTISESLLSDEDIYKMPFWNAVEDGVAFGKVWDAVTYDGAREIGDISYANTDVMFAIAQFLERWILNSVK